MPFVLAHGGQFSWDEALLVVTPLIVIALLLWRANRRATARFGAGEGPTEAATDEPTATVLPGQDPAAE